MIAIQLVGTVTMLLQISHICQKFFEYKVLLLAPVLYIENVFDFDCIKSV